MQRPLRFWLITAPVLIVAGAFGLAMGHDDAVNDAHKAAQQHTTASLPVVVCRDASKEPLVPSEPMTPRFNGVYQGRGAADKLVIVRFYPDGNVYYAVGTSNANLTEAKGWVLPSYAKAHINRTGPWKYDRNGGFIRTSGSATNTYGVWKADPKGTYFNLHVESTFRCPDGETQGSTTYMTFVAD